MMAKVPLRGMVAGIVRKVLEAMYAPGAVVPDLAAASAGGGLADRLVAKYGPHLNQAFDAVEGVRARLGRALHRGKR